MLVLHSVAGFIHMLKEFKFKNKKTAAFGCYGWSGEAAGIINGLMKDAGFTVIGDGFKNSWTPDEDALRRAFDYGVTIAGA